MPQASAPETRQREKKTFPLLEKCRLCATLCNALVFIKESTSIPHINHPLGINLDMLKRQMKMVVAAVAMLLAISAIPARADDGTGILDPNGAIVQTELYLWNRFSDLLDVVRAGVAFGPGLGAEAAVTNYLQLGLYANVEHGMAFPHCLPPLWLVDYYEQNDQAFRFHSGRYATFAFGPWRMESDPGTTMDPKHFERDRWDIRAQVDFLLIHLYLSVRPLEIADFICGIGGYDLTGDDMKLDPLQERRPADQFGRGLCNVLFGVLEIPQNIFLTTVRDGDLAGVTKGVGLGIWRFFCRECVGVVETITFPFGWEPIIEPAYVWDGNENAEPWQVFRPSFHRRY